MASSIVLKDLTKHLLVIVILVCLCLVGDSEVEARNQRDGKRLFGGYRITPRFCQATRETTSSDQKGPNICMFNHECNQRNGIVVGACMDGFLFGACCQVPMAGELVDGKPASLPSNSLYYTKAPVLGHITSSGLSQITQDLLYGDTVSILPTAQEDAVVQINGQEHFGQGGVTHPQAASDTILVNTNNEILPDHFNHHHYAQNQGQYADRFSSTADNRRTTLMDETTQPYVPDASPYVHISITNAPSYTPAPFIDNKPIFKPKPQEQYDRPEDHYVLVPTINRTKNKTQEYDSVVNIIQLLNNNGTKETTQRPLSTSYVYSATTTKRPGYTPTTTTTKATKKTTTYVPSTYTKGTTRKTTTKSKLTTKKRITTSSNKKGTTSRPTSKKPSGNDYVSSSTFRPSQVTYADAQNSYVPTTSRKPPSTSYVYSTTINKRPGSGSVVTSPGYVTGSASYTPSPPAILVLGSSSLSPLSGYSPHSGQYSNSGHLSSSGYPPHLSPTKYTTSRPSTYSTSTKHPVSVTINNHITQHIYNSSERPSPTVLITPKPSITTTPYIGDELQTGGDNLVNFPPVRNPNLNMSASVPVDDDGATPEFVEDDALNTKMESFVNKIIAGLQEPFQGLKHIVYNGTGNLLEPTTKKPVKKQGTTKKPTTLKPSTPPKRPTTLAVRTSTTKKPTRKTPLITITTTTTSSYIENEDAVEISQDYRTQCGVRPLTKTGRIVGGKGATFGEFPWQVLVRESTWLGLFTKNKCGGVLISNKFVMTAAHCQPGFLASLVAVFGEFDLSGNLESKRAVSRNVKRVIVHRQYDAATFENDLALLELEHPIQFDGHIVPICLPRDHEDFTGRMATVTGWGRLKYGGGVPSVLQEVQVPIMENAVCQEMFRTAGHSKVILDSFLCAGYANGQKDSCEGDSGGPLVLQRPDGRYQLAGTVSHGIKCAAPYLPGVYMRTTFYKPWIESITNVH